MMDDDAKRFIDRELAYFEPMIARAARSTEEQRTAWRAETIWQRQERISLEVYEMAKGKVLYGPFEGMKLNQQRWWGGLDLGSQCLGLYEQQVLNELRLVQAEKRYDFFIDIGAADGYYTTGVLYSRIFANGFAFEISSEGRDAISRNWRDNGAPGRLTILGEATSDAILGLSKEVLNGSLFLIDVEGAEFDILSLDVLSKLTQSTLIIEIHNWIDDFEDRYSAFLENAFSLFCVEVIPPVSIDLHQYQELRDFTDDNRLLLLSERRPCQMRFLKLSPRP